MCGIAGWLDWEGEPPAPNIAKAMASVLHHRGPDDGGFHELTAEHGPTVVFSHRRLAIIDLSDAGSQPLTNEDGTIHVLFNGEIYNFADLRTDLLAKGHTFRSSSDTEVIVHTYESFGDDFVRHLDGMFAIALWDARRQRLILARDRVGKKPLYYSWDGRRLAFASEPRALRLCPWVDKTIDPAALHEYLSLGYVPWPATMHVGIRQLPPASMAVSEKRQFNEPASFWAPPFTRLPTRSVSWDTAIRAVEGTLANAIARRLVADVPIGVLLSGGIDSSAVIALMDERRNRMKTFTVGFGEDQTYDEREYARVVARQFGTDHTEVVVKADAAQLLDRIVWFLDQPFADSSAIPMYLISRVAREQVKVVLTGDGGDETFAGYERFSASLLADRLPPWAQEGLARVARVVPRTGGYFELRQRMERFTKLPYQNAERQYSGWLTLFSPDMVDELISEQTGRDPLASHINALAETDGAPLLHRLLHLNMRTYLHDDLLVKTDRMTMANSLEARSPFLDTALIELAAELPPEMKATILQRKRVLRKVLDRTLPTAILRRRKHGFGVPVDLWFRDGLQAVFQDYVLSDSARVRTFLEHRAIERLYREHVAQQARHGGRLWALLTLEAWLRLLERDPEDGPPPEAGIDAPVTQRTLQA